MGFSSTASSSDATSRCEEAGDALVNTVGSLGHPATLSKPPLVPQPWPAALGALLPEPSALLS